MRKVLIFFLLLILIPFLIVGLRNYEELEFKLKYGSVSNQSIVVKRVSKNRIEEVPLEEYVVGVVAGEMPVTFNMEALKAQAVAARTYALKKAYASKTNYDVVDTTTNQVYLDEEDRKLKWKNNFIKNNEKIKEAVIKTKGEVILYNNNLIDALFFSTSNGYTEDSGDVFQSQYPYLVSVTSSWDKTESPVFNTTQTILKNNFFFNLGLSNQEYIEIKDIIKTNTGRVKKITINNVVFDSKTIVKAFSLRSSSFNIESSADSVIFTVSGFGHGVGMSQYGANGMAKEGKPYDQILKYYYQNTNIKKIN
ncbi:MAG: stage II sporulation protein D [Bacilli bacterium]